MTDFPFAIVGFDLDGTLVDTHADLGASLNHALRSAGRPTIPAGEVRDLIGGGARQMLDRALAITGGPMPEAELARTHHDLLDHYRRNIAVHSRLFPGGADVLNALARRGVKLAVVTNKLESLAVRLLEELGVAGQLGAIIGGDTLGPGKAKPAPDLLHAMVSRLGGGRAAFVGDTSYDVRAAQAAHIPCVAVRFGFADLPPDTLGADAVIDHFDELVPALESLAPRMGD